MTRFTISITSPASGTTVVADDVAGPQLGAAVVALSAKHQCPVTVTPVHGRVARPLTAHCQTADDYLACGH